MNALTETRTGGDPDAPEIVFTDLTPTRLEQELEAMGTPANDDTIRRWMDQQDLRLRKIGKVKAGGESPDRDAQFENIAQLIEQYKQAGNPCFSVDTKAKEFQGQLFRAGRIRCSQPFEAFDHDFPSWADGVIIPHGIFDPVRNRGHINIGLSHDTTEFACDSFKWYWNRIGRQSYPDADSILLLVDCGGSNSAAKYIFKHDLQAVVNAIGVEVRVAHYPSYCSKYNPIERRFFPHVGRACTGMLFDTLQRAVGLMRKATTSTGLRTTVNVIKKIYETGRNATDTMKEAIRETVNFHDLLPKWNYTMTPQIGQ
ncbi:MAG: ISAzo13 family transposase [Bythopirellula sp.]